MRDKNFALISVISSMVLLTAAIDTVSAGMVYFYDAKTTGDYKITTTYTQLAKELENKGHKVRPLQVDLSKEGSTEKLRSLNLDVLVIPNLGQDLTTNEMSAIFEIVMKDGKSLFLCGATPSANKVTVPLGMMIPDEMLEDDKSKVRDVSTGQLIEDKTTFFVDLPARRDDPAVSALTRDVSKLNVFGASGIYIFGGNAKSVVTGGDNTVTPKSLIFTEKSYPPIMAYTRLGKGTIAVLTDPDMFADKNLDTKKFRNDNLRLAVNIIDWLSIPSSVDASEEDRDAVMKYLKTENINFNRTVQNLTDQNAQLQQQGNELLAKNGELSKDLAGCRENRPFGLPFDWLTLAMFLLAGCFIVTTLVVLKSGKKGKGTDADQNAEGELGYEFEEKSETGRNGAKIKEEDVEERLKELQKNSQ